MTTSVKSTIAATFTAALASIAGAQIVPPFPTGGPSAFHAPTYASNVASYQSSLGDLYFDSDANVPSSIQTWTNGPVNLTSVFGTNPFMTEGGTVKVMFLGETAGWKNDFGYTRSSSPTTYVPLATDIENSLSGTGNVRSGYETQVSYTAGTSIDFFLNSGGPLTQGGLFYAFGTPNAFSGGDLSSHTKWSVRDVNTTYFNGTSVVTEAVPTLLVGFEDVRKGVSFYDGDFNDFVFGFQFLPTQTSAVPEPSTYGLLGALALAGLVAYRRTRREPAA